MTQAARLNTRRQLVLGSLSAAASAALPAAFAQGSAFPNRAITFICPWPAGGTGDVTMRTLALVASRELGQAVVVENRVGAAGMIGAKALASAKPDGYTIGQLAISVTRFAQLGMVQIDPLKDYSFLAMASAQTFGIVVQPDSPFKNLLEIVAFAKANPDKLTYSTSGVGGQTHVGMEEFALAAGIKLTHVPYKGGAPALQGLLGGQVDMLADSSSWSALVEAKKLVLLATWGAERLPRFKEVPTLKELGFGVVNDAPNGVAAPAGLEPAIEKKLAAAVAVAVNSPEFKAACEKIDAPVIFLDPVQYRQYVIENYKKETILIEKLQLKKLLAS
jgi:tripartite-type tricarboxylate transporter receptor subunit TctC